MSIYKNIPVKELTKYLLDEIKGSQSYDSFVNDMVNYFKMTGISPQSNLVSPVLVMKEQANRIIEVMRGIEKSQKKEFEKIKLHFDQTEISAINPGNILDTNNYLHISEVEELIQKTKDLSNQNENYAIEINKLRTEKETTKKTKAENKNSINPSKVDEILEKIQSLSKTNSFNPNILEFDKNTLNEWFKRLKKELKIELVD